MVLAAPAAPVAAQQAAEEMVATINMSGHAVWWKEAGIDESTLLRRAEPAGAITTLLDESDAAVKAWVARPESLYLTFRLGIDAAGRVSQCTPKLYGSRPVPAWAEGFCAALRQRGRFLPALDTAGKGVADQFNLAVDFRLLPKRYAQPGQRVINEQQLSPAPPPPPGQHLEIWPPYSYWVSSNPNLATLKRPAEPAGSVPPATGAWAGVELTLTGSKADCHIVEASDPATAAAACAYVRRVLKPKLPPSEAGRSRRSAMLLVPEGKAFRVYLPDSRRQKSAAFPPGAWEALTASWYASVPAAARPREASVQIATDASGAITGCFLTDSSGSDQGDLALCRLVRAQPPLTPATDVFGRAVAGSRWYRVLPPR